MNILNDRSEFISQANTGSHAPLESALHWDWRNPLTILPALLLLACAIALLSALMQLV